MTVTGISWPAVRRLRVRGIYGPSNELCPVYLFDLGYNYIFSASVRDKESYLQAQLAPLPVGEDLKFMDLYIFVENNLGGGRAVLLRAAFSFFRMLRAYRHLPCSNLTEVYAGSKVNRKEIRRSAPFALLCCFCKYGRMSIVGNAWTNLACGLKDLLLTNM